MLAPKRRVINPHWCDVLSRGSRTARPDQTRPLALEAEMLAPTSRGPGRAQRRELPPSTQTGGVAYKARDRT